MKPADGRRISAEDEERLAVIEELEQAMREGDYGDEERRLYFDLLVRLEHEGFRAWYGRRFGIRRSTN